MFSATDVFDIAKTLIELTIVVTAIIVTVRLEIKQIKKQQTDMMKKINKIAMGDIIDIGDRLSRHREEIDDLKSKFDKIIYLLEQKLAVSLKKQEMDDDGGC